MRTILLYISVLILSFSCNDSASNPHTKSLPFEKTDSIKQQSNTTGDIKSKSIKEYQLYTRNGNKYYFSILGKTTSIGFKKNIISKSYTLEKFHREYKTNYIGEFTEKKISAEHIKSTLNKKIGKKLYSSLRHLLHKENLSNKATLYFILTLSEGGHYDDEIAIFTFQENKETLSKLVLDSEYQRDGYSQFIKSEINTDYTITRSIQEIITRGEIHPERNTIQKFKIDDRGELVLIFEKTDSINFDLYKKI